MVEHSNGRDDRHDFWVPELHLTHGDNDILLENEWLNDRIINAAQNVLKQANSAISGLQDVNHGPTMMYDIQHKEFVQILHNGHNHWLTVSTVGVRCQSVRF